MAANHVIVDNFTLAGEAIGSRRERTTIRHISDDEGYVAGLRFDCGYLSPYFITDPERMEVAFEDACVLVCEGKISSRKDLLPILAQIMKMGQPLVIIGEVDGEALASLVVAKLRGPLQLAAVAPPGCGEQRKRMLRKIALMTGGMSIAEGLESQLKNLQISDLGRAHRITIDKNHTWVEGDWDVCALSLGAEAGGEANAVAALVQPASVQPQRKMARPMQRRHDANKQSGRPLGAA